MLKTIVAYFQKLFSSKPPQPTKLVSPRGRDVFATGTFQDATLYDLLVALIQGGKSARLRIHIGSEKAIILLVDGKIVNALYHGYIGEAAVLEIFADVDTHEDAVYFAEALEAGAVPTAPTSIALSMDQLLLKIATQLDQSRQEAGELDQLEKNQQQLDEAKLNTAW